MIRSRPLVPGERVLVRLPSWLGDLVMAEPAVRGLVERFERWNDPEGLSLAVPRHLAPVLEGKFPATRRILHEGRGGERASDWRGHDVAILLNGSFRSAWTAWRARIRRRIGLARDGRAMFLTESMVPPRERGATPLGLGTRGRWPRYLPRPFTASAIEIVGLAGVTVADARPRLVVIDGARAGIERRLAALDIAASEPFVLANVGARPGSAKGYPVELWVRVVRGLAKEGLRSVLVCGPGEEDGLRQVRALGRCAAILDPVATLPELAALCARASVVVTADTGPRHVANALGARLVVVCGPTDPRHSADHLEQTELARVEVDCGPCHRERCPLEGRAEHACMKRVEPERLVSLAVASIR